MWLRRKLQLLGGRADPQDPMRQVVFQPNSLIPGTEHTRLDVLEEQGRTDAFRELGNPEQFDIQNAQHRNLVNNSAQQRAGIFSKHCTVTDFVIASIVTERFFGHLPGPAQTQLFHPCTLKQITCSPRYCKMFVLIYIFSPTLFLRKCVLQGKATFFHDRCKTVAVDSALGSGLCVATNTLSQSATC